jgi:hypothetical protein
MVAGCVIVRRHASDIDYGIGGTHSAPPPLRRRGAPVELACDWNDASWWSMVVAHCADVRSESCCAASTCSGIVCINMAQSTWQQRTKRPTAYHCRLMPVVHCRTHSTPITTAKLNNAGMQRLQQSPHHQHHTYHTGIPHNDMQNANGNGNMADTATACFCHAHT